MKKCSRLFKDSSALSVLLKNNYIHEERLLHSCLLCTMPNNLKKNYYKENHEVSVFPILGVKCGAL